MVVARTTPRRTQKERSDSTTADLVAAARKLFAEQGYAATSLDQITRAAKVTKGALYHHFQGKPAIFRAVCEEEQRQLNELQSKAFRSKSDAWEGFQAGCLAYLTAAGDPGFQRIMLLDAPGVLGWEGVRAVESDTWEMSLEGLRRAMKAGRIPRRAPEPLLEVLFGALGGAAMAIARADDQQAAQRAMSREVRRVLDGLSTD
jgi:AcrR family transcriptional regulator